MHVFILPKRNPKDVKGNVVSFYQILQLRQTAERSKQKNSVSDQKALDLHSEAITETRNMLDRADYRVQENKTKWTRVSSR